MYSSHLCTYNTYVYSAEMSESILLFQRVCQLVKQGILLLETRKIDKTVLLKVKNVREQIDSIDRKLKDLRTEDVVVVDFSTQRLNTNLLFASASVHILLESFDRLFEYSRQSEYQSFAALKDMLKVFTEKLQSKVSAGDSPPSPPDPSNPVVQGFWTGQYGAALYQIHRHLNRSVKVNMMLPVYGDNEEKKMVEFSSHENVFYQLTCLVIYKDYKSLLDLVENSNYTTKAILKFDRATRDALIKLLSICKWMDKHKARAATNQTNQILFKMSRLLDSSAAITAVNRMCNPYDAYL